MSKPLRGFELTHWAVTRMRVWSFLIIAAVIAFPRHVLNATDIGSPPLPPPRPTEQPLHPTPQDNALVEQSKPNSALDQACLDRLGDVLITFETITLPLPANPGCAIETPVRLKAVMSSRGPILLPEATCAGLHRANNGGRYEIRRCVPGALSHYRIEHVTILPAHWTHAAATTSCHEPPMVCINPQRLPQNHDVRVHDRAVLPHGEGNG